jgi:hypothetical protein
LYEVLWLALFPKSCYKAVSHYSVEGALDIHGGECYDLIFRKGFLDVIYKGSDKVDG